MSIKNRGFGAGGKNTTLNGLSFEIKTSIEKKLLESNYNKIVINNKQKYGYYLEYKEENKQIIFLLQSGFKSYFKKKYNINIYKHPDEAFIIYNNDNIYIKIIEKKNQNVEGSVEDKLKTGLFNKKEYERMLKSLKNINISYSFCVSKFLQNKFESNIIKYKNMKDILDEDNIKLFYGEEMNYNDNLLDWINKN